MVKITMGLLTVLLSSYALADSTFAKGSAVLIKQNNSVGWVKQSESEGRLEVSFDDDSLLISVDDLVGEIAEPCDSSQNCKGKAIETRQGDVRIVKHIFPNGKLYVDDYRDSGFVVDVQDIVAHQIDTCDSDNCKAMLALKGMYTLTVVQENQPIVAAPSPNIYVDDRASEKELYGKELGSTEIAGFLDNGTVLFNISVYKETEGKKLVLVSHQPMVAIPIAVNANNGKRPARVSDINVSTGVAQKSNLNKETTPKSL
jgi:hypothetical protein